jgi:hypothetical protein
MWTGVPMGFSETEDLHPARQRMRARKRKREGYLCRDRRGKGWDSLQIMAFSSLMVMEGICRSSRREANECAGFIPLFGGRRRYGKVREMPMRFSVAHGSKGDGTPSGTSSIRFISMRMNQ